MDTGDKCPPERLDCVSLSPLGIMRSWKVRMLVFTHWSTHLFILLLGGPKTGVPELRPSFLCWSSLPPFLGALLAVEDHPWWVLRSLKAWPSRIPGLKVELKEAARGQHHNLARARRRPGWGGVCHPHL